MPPKRKGPPASAAVSRLAVLAAGDERAFAAYALELLESRDRLAREAALEALAETPVASTRPALRELYAELDADGLKRDQGARMRGAIVRSLTKIGDTRDIDIAVRASETSEIAFGDDIARTLRGYGLRMLAALTPDKFAYYAIEHLDDMPDDEIGEPANTAFQLLTGTGQHVPVYQWLISRDREPVLVAAVFQLLIEAPREIVERYISRTVEVARRRGNDALAIVLAEAIVNLEIERAYEDIAGLLSSKISDELYNYLAVLLAATNRAPLLAILEQELRHGRRPRAVAEALRVRTTPEQEEILRRWEEAEGDDDDRD